MGHKQIIFLHLKRETCRAVAASHKSEANVAHSKVKALFGPDYIPLKEVCKCADEFAPSLTTLFHLSMSTCTLPEEWKYSNVVLIHKKVRNAKLIITDHFSTV